MKLLTHPMSIIVQIRTQNMESKRSATPDAVARYPSVCRNPPSDPQSERVVALPMFHFGRPRTPLQWISHILLGIVALLLVIWMLRVFVL
jgi:hypothetical protein